MNDTTNKTTVKQRLKSGKATCGAFLQMNSHVSAEILSRAGFDWLIVDMEHGPVDIDGLLRQLQAIGCASACAPFVRAPWNDPVAIKRILDTGAQGIVVPYVNTREEAEAAVSACLFPPEGTRGAAMSPRAAGYGMSTTGYFARANAETIVIVSVETEQAMNNLDDILAVEGIDGIFIGPMDLAISLGHKDVDCSHVRNAMVPNRGKGAVVGQVPRYRRDRQGKGNRLLRTGLSVAHTNAGWCVAGAAGSRGRWSFSRRNRRVSSALTASRHCAQ